MSLPERFRFQARLPNKSGTFVEFKAKEIEELLLKQAREENEQVPSTLVQLVSVYLRNGDQARADLYLERLDSLCKKN